MKNKDKWESLKVQKVKFEYALAFAKEAMEDEYIVSLLNIELYHLPQKDDEVEHLMSKISQWVSERIDEKGISWKYKSGYREGLRITRAVMTGQLNGFDDPKAKDLMKKSFFIEVSK